MASPSSTFPVSSPALDQWRAEAGERLTYSEVAWTGAAVALITHATVHFFSVAIPALERLLIVFGPPEQLAFGITREINPLATWLLLILAVATWGALIGVALLSAVHEATDGVRRMLHRRSLSGDRAQGASPLTDPAAFPGRYSPEPP